MNWTGQTILVLGLGSSGLAAVRWLHQRGAQVRVADQSIAPPGLQALQVCLPDVPVNLGAWRAEDFDWAAYIVISPGVPMAQDIIQQAIQRGVRVWSDIEVFARAVSSSAKVIAITGSNGKSTVTSMVAAMCTAAGLSVREAGNIGVPVLDVLADDVDVFVLELSSFQLEAIYSLRSDAAVLLNVSEDHLDRYADMQAYTTAKARIYQGAALQVVNRDDVRALQLAQHTGAQVSFGLNPPVREQDMGVVDGFMCRGAIRLLPVTALQVTGRHNVSNALAAWALCHAMGLPDEPLAEALRAFTGLAHRVQWVAQKGGVNFYDDSKGTNVGATVAAVQGMSQPIILIAGGEGKGQDFTPLASAVDRHVRAVVQIGRDGPLIARALVDTPIPVLRAQSMHEAVELAFAQAKPGDAVLLSPACASFDMFDNYVHRARVFVQAVMALAKEST